MSGSPGVGQQQAPEKERWFGEFEVPIGTSLHWRLGPLSFSVQRTEGEWRLQKDASGDVYDSTLNLERHAQAEEEPLDSSVQRFLVANDSSRLRVGILLPDRSIVSRPSTPVSIPPGETVRFYLSYPVWISLAVGEQARLLTEFPSHQLSDTWFGPNTRLGSVCYATRTRCRLDLHQYPHIPNRANTPLVVRNLAADTLHIEKLQLPVATLSVYRAEADGWLWTETVTVTRREDGDMAELLTGSGAPAQAGTAELVSGPRQKVQRHAVFRAFSALF
ncbi:hypothetical protein M0534_11865 [Methylonatrum kenyense]|uniref:hypothetical protein n=1 Tax=Methylonatrum kenyense TaxID=455253 RepID=UPI0020BD5102|nr:hypothetical protein [Methylonatrum kenyense]MCK8517015.1 hypothetical protein [Methylonatrum kenyense]